MDNNSRHRTPGLALGYQDLRVWQAAADLATECYVRTAAFPAAERFGLAAQMRRAAVSVVSNIAEGHGRRSRPAFVHFLGIARGSLNELEAQALLAVRLNLMSPVDAALMAELCDGTARMLHGLQAALREQRSSRAAQT